MAIPTVSRPASFSFALVLNGFYCSVELNPEVQSYLDDHLLRSFSQKSTVTMRAAGGKPRHLRRRMSVKGAIKKTRSINVDCEFKIGGF
jgi:hypothetical protein